MRKPVNGWNRNKWQLSADAAVNARVLRFIPRAENRGFRAWLAALVLRILRAFGR